MDNRVELVREIGGVASDSDPHYTTPHTIRFGTKKRAREWRREYLAATPRDYWIAPAGKYLLDENGELRPCFKTKNNDQATGRGLAFA